MAVVKSARLLLYNSMDSGSFLDSAVEVHGKANVNGYLQVYISTHVDVSHLSRAF